MSARRSMLCYAQRLQIVKGCRHKCEITERRRVAVCQGEAKKRQPDRGGAIMKGSERLRDKMKEIKLTDRFDITFNPLLIFSAPQLSGSSRDDQISCEGLSWRGLTTILTIAEAARGSLRSARELVLPLPPLVKTLGLQCSLLLGA